MATSEVSSRVGRARPFVILDRDGTLNVEKHHLCDPDGLELLPTVLDGLRALRAHGFGLVVATNQSVVGRGMLDLAGLSRMHARLEALLGAGGVTLDGIYACPHHPDDGCRCRKPAPGLVEQAVGAHGFDPRWATVIGDGQGDVELGRSVGATTILVTTGHGRRVLEAGVARPHAVAESFAAAAQLVIDRGPDPT